MVEVCIKKKKPLLPTSSSLADSSVRQHTEHRDHRICISLSKMELQPAPEFSSKNSVLFEVLA